MRWEVTKAEPGPGPNDIVLTMHYWKDSTPVGAEPDLIGDHLLVGFTTTDVVEDLPETNALGQWLLKDGTALPLWTEVDGDWVQTSPPPPSQAKVRHRLVTQEAVLARSLAEQAAVWHEVAEGGIPSGAREDRFEVAERAKFAKGKTHRALRPGVQKFVGLRGSHDDA